MGILFMIALLFLMPLAVFSEHPGITPAGAMQLLLIAGSMIGAAVFVRRNTIAGRIGSASAAYPVGTFISNLCAFALDRHLLH